MSETSVDEEIQKATEELVPHHDRCKEIAENKGTGVFSWVMPG